MSRRGWCPPARPAAQRSMQQQQQQQNKQQQQAKKNWSCGRSTQKCKGRATVALVLDWGLGLGAAAADGDGGQLVAGDWLERLHDEPENRHGH